MTHWDTNLPIISAEQPQYTCERRTDATTANVVMMPSNPPKTMALMYLKMEMEGRRLKRYKNHTAHGYNNSESA